MALISFLYMDSPALLNFGLLAMAAGPHPAQILRAQHITEPKVPAAHVAMMFSKNIVFFDLGHFPVTLPLRKYT